jgi:hypothetical protein
MKNGYTILVGKFEGKTPLVMHRRKWEDNIITLLSDTGFGGVDWIHPAQFRDWCRALQNMII